jgi:hypothetical protein
MKSRFRKGARLALPLLFLAASVLTTNGFGGPGNALSFFGGPVNYVSVPHDPALNAYPLTVTAWISAFQAPELPIISKSPPFGTDGWSIRFSFGQLSATYGNGSSYVPGVNGGFISDGQWRHVAFVVDASGGKLYLNGILQGSQSWVGTAGPSPTTMDMIFGPPPALSTSFQGTLDEITVWNVALSQAQIQFNMNRSLTGTEPGLVAYYRCDETGYGMSADSAPASGTNSGSWFGAIGSIPSGVLPFTPFAETLAAASLNPTNATLNGVANPEGTNTSAWFEWGTTTNYGNATSAQSVGSIATYTNFSQVITGLLADGTYQFRTVASNVFGMALGTNQTVRPRLFTLVTNLPGGQNWFSAAWGDYDNDGRLDIFSEDTGYSNQAFSNNQFWRNTGNGFTKHIYLLGSGGTLRGAWSDFDNDGWLDIAFAARLWRNVGNDFAYINVDLPPVFGTDSSLTWGDYDNNGGQDLLFGGRAASIPFLWLSRNTSAGFTNLDLGTPLVSYSSVAWGDYDNDGQLDILLSGNSASPLTQVWRNTGSGFTNINAALPGVANGSCAWGDYDNDGRLDILLTGLTNRTLPLMSSNLVSQVWRNTGTGFTNINTGLPGVYFSSVTWGDCDNDGRLDILLTGATNISTTFQATGFVSQIWLNTSNGFTNLNADLPGIAEGSCAWGDYDNDGRLDVLLAGATKMNTNGTVTEAICQVWRNYVLRSNTPPTAPTNLTATAGVNTVTFSWSAASDLQMPSAGLSYNLRVGTFPGGSDVVGPMAASNGWRRLPQQGNAGQNRFRTMALPPRPLYWSVQAVDNAFAGGPFSAESFVILRPSLTIARAGREVLISWPVNAGNYILEATPTLSGNPPWVTVLPPYFTNGDYLTITNPPTGESRFYRLRPP